MPKGPRPEVIWTGAFVMSRGAVVPSVLAVDSLDDLVSTTDAAKAVGVDAATIRSWAFRGSLAKSGLDERNRPLYRLIDVVRVARDTRRRAIGAHRVA
jgi:hypothetical protein